MKTLESLTLKNNTEKKQFELLVENNLARIEYIKTQDKIYLTHTEVPSELEGKGVGTAMVHKTLEWVKNNDLTLIPLCPFVALYIKKNPEYKSLVLKGINIA
ncbi:N-acetyltransferase [Dokdonia sinensis]|uniref:N-acetyltransferase n=1 Tax=Dokdonia sinensis TaxID=2479847 RepID=A0A3M0G7I1_9FLAO|nr:GNAT family N-acetyltransferase [Dokdonia sinensis]RMB57643.1 N-acetyltransferase [Dokdonia sinensis]